MRRDPFQAASKLPGRLALNVCSNTMRKVLKKECNLNYHKAAEKTELRNRDRVACVAFANAHLYLNAENWRRSIFMDEKSFSTHKDGRIGVWRPIGTR